MLTITKLNGAEYLIASVAQGLEDYYLGVGEAPGVWRGRWAAGLGLEGVVEAEHLRALVNGLDPLTGDDLLAGHRERKVRAVDVTLSVPKSVSLLWAFGTLETSAAVSIAVVEATDTALAFLEERAAFARQQQSGVRRRAATDGFAVATFAHRTSRAGDPQLHVHCLIPNVVRRADGAHVAFDANPLHVWAKATGTVFLNDLERILTERLGVAWGPDRNGCRELVGFSREQLRAFSKRTVAIETHLEAAGELAFDSRRQRMRADDRASLTTRQPKDRTLTPERLRDRWAVEATAVDLRPGVGVDDLVVGRQVGVVAEPADAEVFAALVDPATGLCATESRFCVAHVVERVAALSGGRLNTTEIVAVAERFLASGLVVRLAPDLTRRRPPEWSTVEHRRVEDRLLDRLHSIVATVAAPIDSASVDAAIASEPKRLGRDQAAAVRVLCGAGSSVRVLTAPPGHGKTTALHAASGAAMAAGRPVEVVAPTHKAVGELRAAGLEAGTVARLRRRLAAEPLAAGTVLVVDEVSQVGTRDADVLVDALVRTPGAQLWCIGDPRQAQSVAAGGLAVELERLASGGAIPVAGLAVNRRQRDPAEREALARFRAGDLEASRAIRSDHGWEHELATPTETRQALADAAVADADRHGAEQVAVLAVSHADCEDVADRVRAIRAARGELRGPSLAGPGWGNEPRTYAAGDRVLVHATLGAGPDRPVVNGSAGTVLTVSASGLAVLLDDGRQAFLGAELVAGHRPDGTPNLSHAWARTVDGAQGGTWRQVHLLGTPALDRHTGYVGQSRGQLPTHTWHTRPDADHPARLLADDRSPAEAVLDAMRRDEPKTFAAADDPWVLDRQLRAERDDHAAVIADRPPDARADLDEARRRLTGAVEDHDGATRGLVYYRHERDRLGPLTKLRRGGRDGIARADEALAAAHRRLDRAVQGLTTARAEVACLEATVAGRAAWDDTQAWRLARVGEIEDALAHHWADVVVRAVRADDPLAFGVDRLRDARFTYRADLRRVLDGLPEDRRDTLARAEADLRHYEHNLAHAERSVGQARLALERANERHWGRRDKPALASAGARLRQAETDRRLCLDAVARSRKVVDDERHVVQAWAAATRETADERTDLTRAIADVDDALTVTRPERVAAAVADPSSELSAALGPPPTTRGGLAAWCGIAERIEARQDQRPGPDRWIEAIVDRRASAIDGRGLRGGRTWDKLTALVNRAEEVIDVAGRLDAAPARQPLDDRAIWQSAVEAADQAIALERPSPVLDSGLDLGL